VWERISKRGGGVIWEQGGGVEEAVALTGHAAAWGGGKPQVKTVHEEGKALCSFRDGELRGNFCGCRAVELVGSEAKRKRRAKFNSRGNRLIGKGKSADILKTFSERAGERKRCRLKVHTRGRDHKFRGT